MANAISNFNQRLDTLAKAVGEGHLINDQLQVVKKGFCWNLSCFFRRIFSCGKGDPFVDVRVGNVARAIYSEYHKTFPEVRLGNAFKTAYAEYDRMVPLPNLNNPQAADARVKIEGILERLDQKTHHKYHKEVVLASQVLNPEESQQTVHSTRTTRSTTQTSSASKQAVLGAINNCAHKLHELMIRKSTDNICFAPLSIAAILGMVLKAKSPEDKRKFLEAMGLENTPEADVHAATMEIINDLAQASGDQCIFNFANAIAINFESRGGIDDSFIETIKKTYKGEIFSMIGIEEINRWVSRRMRGKIPNLLQEVPSDLRVALISAMYFSASWEKKFNLFGKELFKFANGSMARVEMIHKMNKYPLCKTESWRMLEIPYKAPSGHRLSCVVFLPNSANECSALTRFLTPERIKDARARAVKQDVSVTMPKLDVDARIEKLLELLKEIGLPLEDSLPLIGNQEISAIIHQAKLKIDEKGAEGAAATVVTLAPTCCMRESEVKIEEFKVNHDFIYFIMDGDAILFQGSVRNQSALVV